MRPSSSPWSGGRRRARVPLIVAVQACPAYFSLVVSTSSLRSRLSSLLGQAALGLLHLVAGLLGLLDELLLPLGDLVGRASSSSCFWTLAASLREFLTSSFGLALGSGDGLVARHGLDETHGGGEADKQRDEGDERDLQWMHGGSPFLNRTPADDAAGDPAIRARAKDQAGPQRRRAAGLSGGRDGPINRWTMTPAAGMPARWNSLGIAKDL